MFQKLFYILGVFFWIQCQQAPPRTAPENLVQKPQQKIVYPTNADGFIEIDWQLLAQTRISQSFDEDSKEYLPKAFFPDSVLYLDQKKIRIKGYLFDYDASQQEYILSAKPEEKSYYYGKDSLESVIRLHLKNKISTGKLFVVCGTLQLNSQNPKKSCFRLQDAKICR